ncbi:glycosyltransferase involved in cell wall biosynthesis [Sagittula marina]|uniref:Glycosyltransferase involved in cell wall biosynthesis n=1 Tax=Sagittula marina TaxID=943940 RepID=A0A7W6GQP9_9RHOB|nr:glycosyltransferase [Sagittula marina]MBB3983837.1 glycosyltransferase involved in cell wall biosynthesis [Sagittula marina]
MTLPKLAYLTGEYPRASDTFIQREVAALRALGHEVETCSIRTTGAEHLVGPEQRAEHTRTFKVLDACKGPRLMRAHLRYLKRPRRYMRALKLAWTTAPKGIKGRLYNLIYFAEAAVLADHMQRQGIDHLHNHIAKASCTVAMLASEMSGIPYSFTIHGPDIFFEPHHWRIDEKSERAAFVACISDFARSQLMCFANQIHWDRFHVIHCGVDPSRYTSAPHDAQNMLFVGRLAGVKGVPVLLRAIALLRHTHPDLRLTLIGDGPERAAIDAYARQLDMHPFITFMGYRSQAEVAEELSRTDLFVLPSFAEGVPVVLMEAMASGVPVVTTRIAGVSELVRDNAGTLVAPGDADALAQAIADTLARDDRREMGAQGRAIVETDYNIHTEAARLSTLFTTYARGEQPPKRPEPAA